MSTSRVKEGYWGQLFETQVRKYLQLAFPLIEKTLATGESKKFNCKPKDTKC